MKKQRKSIYDSIRKPLAPPTKIFKNHRKEKLIKSIEKDNEYPQCEICECDLPRVEKFTKTGEICWECYESKENIKNNVCNCNEEDYLEPYDKCGRTMYCKKCGNYITIWD